MKVCILKKAALLSFFLILAFSDISFGQNISVTATVDKNNLTLEDSLQLSIVIKGSKNTPPPQLPSLPDFRVTSAGTSSSTQYINTQRSVSITYNYRLRPMNTGTILIGPAKVQINGKNYSPQPITVEVQVSTNSATNKNKVAFVEASLSSKKAYLGEQLVYTFRLFHRVEAKNLDLRLPFDKAWFSKEDLGEPKTYIKVVNGLQYHVQELSIALFPLKKGLVEIPSSIIELDLYQRAKTRSRHDPFDQFFRDPFFSQGVQVGNSLHMAGQVGTDAAGVAPNDLVEQMSLAYGHVQNVLAEFNATMDNIVDETWFVTDIDECMGQVEALFAERQRRYGKIPEVSQTLVQVAGLVDPSFKIEIKCIAITD